MYFLCICICIYMCIYMLVELNDFEIQMHCVWILAQMQLRNGYRRDRIHQGLALQPIRVFHSL